MSEAVKERIDLIFKIAMVTLTTAIAPWGIWVTQSVYSMNTYREVSTVQLNHINLQLGRIELAIKEASMDIKSLERGGGANRP